MNQINEDQKKTEGFGIATLERSAELAAIAVAAAAKAEVEAGYIMALKKPRNDENARTAILDVCKNPTFAEKAIYKKPVGGQVIEGPSIRFAEEMLRHWGNVKALQNCIFEDSEKRIVKITVIDLEANLSYSKEITVEKKVERKDPKGREVLGDRFNTQRQKVFIVKATEDELQNKEAALSSKVIRNNGLRLIPEYIIQEAMETAYEAMKVRINKDPKAEKRKVLDAFSQLGIKPSDIEKYLGHKIDQVTPAEILDLRQVYSALKDGQARWSDYVQSEEKNGGDEMPKTKKDPAKRDQKKAEDPKINEAQLRNLRQVAQFADVDLEKRVKKEGFQKVEDIPMSVYAKVLTECGNIVDEKEAKKQGK